MRDYTHLAMQANDWANQNGFMRRSLVQRAVEPGRHAKLDLFVKMKTNLAVVTSSLLDGESVQKFTTDIDFFPPEFFINRDNLAEVDMEDLLFDTVPKMVATEDKLWFLAMDTIMMEDHRVETLSHMPEDIMPVIEKVTQWGIPAARILMSSKLWRLLLEDFWRDGRWAELIEPATSSKDVESGLVGKVHGMDIFSDYSRNPNAREVMKGLEFYVVSPPEMHGQYTDRGFTIEVEEDNQSIYEVLSMVVANERSVAKGIVVSDAG